MQVEILSNFNYYFHFNISTTSSYSSETVGTVNDFGDKQLDVDLKTDAIIFNHLIQSKLVHVAASEENPQVASRLHYKRKYPLLYHFLERK
jgi:fructose-1,6-bisphosphatase